MQTSQTKTLGSKRSGAASLRKFAFFDCETVKLLEPSRFNGLTPSNSTGSQPLCICDPVGHPATQTFSTN